jgi:hypothetical protein
MRIRGLFVAATIGILSSAAPIQAQVPVSVIVPSAQATALGNSSNQFPFNPRSVGTTTIRYQQVYGASEFAPGIYLITQIAFRAEPPGTGDPVFPPFTGTTGTLQVDLSTTSAAPDALSTTFADNLGADTITVFGGHWALSTANSGQFDLILNLTTPFEYNPANGNLLMDVRNSGGGTIDVLNNFFVAFDAQNTAGDSTSRVYTAQSQNGVNLLTGVRDPAGSLGLVTRFSAQFVANQTPQQQIQGLVDAVNALAGSGTLNFGQANGVTRPLENALRSLSRGKLTPACSQLSDFQDGVNQLVADGVLSSQQGAILSGAAARVRDSLGCS